MSIFEHLDSISRDQNNPQASQMGIRLAEVTSIDDPQEFGRVKCRFLTKEDEEYELDWAYVMTPFGGKESGFYFMPNVKDIVLVAFEDGDVSRPYIIGGVWGQYLDPPVKIKKGGKNETYMIKTPNKSTIEFSDVQGKEVITVKTPKERKVELNDDKKQIVMTDGGSSITLDEGGGEVKITCKSKLTIEIGSGAKLTIDGNAGTVELKANQSVKIEGTQVDIEAKAAASLKGNGQVSVESGGMTTVKGSMLKLN